MNKRESTLLLVIALIALAARIIWILQLDNTVNVWNDWWDVLADNLVSGKGYVVNDPIIPSGNYYYSWRPPLFPFFLAGIYFLFGQGFLIPKIFMALLGAFTSLLVYFIAKRLFNSSAGFLSALGTALHPAFIFFTGYLAPVTLLLFLTVLFIFFFFL